MLLAIKLLHTAIWAVIAASILVLPMLALRRRYRWCGWLSALVLFECAVLMANWGRCPVTDWAAQYTADRAHNFDIFLPEWLAQHNKRIFGTLFAIGEGVFLGMLLRDRIAGGRAVTRRRT